MGQPCLAMLARVTAIVCGSVLFAGSSIAADAPPKFTLSSSALKNGGFLPKKYAGNNPQNKNCDGQGISLPLAWKNAPANTKSFAILMTDLVGRGGMGVSHWVAYGIPATKTSLKEGEASQPSADFVGGKNTPGTTLYYGPCPPMTDVPHPYVIVLIATDVASSTLQPGMTAAELGTALNGHTLGATSFVANYRR
jgi:Raf kinase inhibitor-like YbhB/YbcL family protein